MDRARSHRVRARQLRAARFCPLAPAVTPIHQAQGAGAATPCAGEDVTIEGVVVGDYEGAGPTLRGFYVQEDDADVDADPATSEGSSCSTPATTTSASATRSTSTGIVAEFQGQTQINFPDVLTILSTGNTRRPRRP